MQQTFIEKVPSSQQQIAYVVPQVLVVGPFLVLIFINELNEAGKHSIIHHFADETNGLYSNMSTNT